MADTPLELLQGTLDVLCSRSSRGVRSTGTGWRS